MSFDEPDLTRRLSALPARARLAMALACASRLVAPYRRACRSLGREDSAQPEAVEALWRFILGAPADDWAGRSASLVALIPDEDEMTTYAHSVLDDALAATVFAINAAASLGVQDAVWAARRLIDAVDTRAQEDFSFDAFTPEIDKALQEHPVVQTELSRQVRDLTELEAAADVAPVIAKFAERNESAWDAEPRLA